MVSTQGKGIIIFFSYAARDKILRDRLEEHLSNLKYRGLITAWHDRKVLAGSDLRQHIDAMLQQSQIILLLISSTFMASEYCYGSEMQQALQLHDLRKAIVIPVLLRPVLFAGAPFSRLSMLPANGRPVTKWRDRDSAFVDVAVNIERVAEQYLRGGILGAFVLPPPLLRPAYAEPSSTYGSDDAHTCPYCLAETQAWESACLRCGKPLPARTAGSRGWPGSTTAQADRTQAYSEPQVLSDSTSLENPGFAATRRLYYIENVVAYEHALRANPGDVTAVLGLGKALLGLERYEEALGVFESAGQQESSAAYAGMGDAALGLKLYPEAVVAYENALDIDPGANLNYAHCIQALRMVGKSKRAEEVRERAVELGYFDENEEREDP